MSPLLAKYSQYNLAHPTLYALITLSCIWTFGGGIEDNFFARVLIGSALLWVWLLAFYYTYRRYGDKMTQEPLEAFGPYTLKADLSTLLKALPLSAVFTGLTLLFYFISTQYWGWTESFNYFQNLPPFTLICTAVLFHAALEIIFRGVFSPAWGYGNSAFLEAAMWASCTQKIGPMLVIWVLGIGLGRVSLNWGLKYAVYCRVLWALITLTLLKVF